MVPYGLWWSAIFAVSIINPLFGLRLEIHDIPPDIKSMALVLIPAILLGDVARGGLAMLRR